MANGADEYPEQSYFPSWKIRLGIRFDEFGQTTQLAENAPKKITTKLKGITDKGPTLKVVADPEAPQGVSRLLLEPPSGPTIGGPQQQDKSADDLTQIVGGIIPLNFGLGLNGIRTADTLKVDLKFIDLPIDPRVVRSCWIQFFLGTILEEDFRAGMKGALRGLNSTTTSSDAGEPLSIIGDVDHRGVSTLRFEGWVDEWEAEWPESEEPVVHLDCRDNTTILIDQDAPPKLVVDAKAPIDRAVATYLANFPQFAGLSIEYRPGGVDIPNLATAFGKTAYRPNLGPAASKGGGAGSKLSVWDYLTDVAGALGHTIRVEGTVIVIQRTRELLKDNASARPDDPFLGRTLPSGRVITNRQVIYGRNLQDMKIGRKFSKFAPQNIEVRSYNPSKKQVLVARFPLPGDTLVGRALPGQGGEEQKWFVWRVAGIADARTLRIIAQGIYESLGRSELSVHFRTKNLASFGGGNLDPDLLDMKAGDAVELLVNRDEDELSSTTMIENLFLVQERAAQFLTHVGFSPAFSKAYGRAYTNANFQQVYRTRSIGIAGDVDQGVQIEIQAVNFLEVRNDKLLPQGEEITSAQTAGQPKQQQGKSGGPKK